MSLSLRTALVTLTASALAVWVGVALAQEEHFIAFVSALVSVWAVLAWTRGPLAETWLLAFLVFGYVNGNRGFAQIMPIRGTPLFLSELGLVVVVTLVLLRGAMSRVLPVRTDWLNGLLLLWLALGAGRLPWDIRSHGLLALRDFATVYYVLYFFAAQALAHHPASHRLLHTTYLVTFGVLPFAAAAFSALPNFFAHNMLIDGVPLIHLKGDLLASFLFTGFIILLPHGPFSRHSPVAWRWLLALAALVLGLGLLSRASMVGLLVATGWLALSGRWNPLKVIAGVCLAGVLGLAALSVLPQQDHTQTRIYAVYEATASILDFSGTRNYRSEQADSKGDNNRFRLIWWRNVAEETLQTSPVFGLGFGADLARGFLQEYYPDSGEDFTARSPHNIFMTTLGRMGLVGVAALLLIYVVQFRVTMRTVRAARSDPARQDALTMQAACWVLLISSCFGVVLEGPMGAIPFWIMLGLAHHDATREPATAAAAETKDERPETHEPSAVGATA